MSTLRTFNLQHPESSNNNIQLAEGGGVSVTAGILTATNVSSTNVTTTNVTTTEVTATNGTFSGNLSVGGVLSYEDVTNVDSTGIGTFRDGLHVTGGSVGIGTDAPAAGNKLHLQDTSACRIQLTTDNTGHTLSDGTRLMVDSSNNFEILNRENSNIEFFTNNTERLRIASDGKLGINETSPDVLLHLTEDNADPFNTVITHLKLDNAGGNGGSGSRIELKTGAARCWIQSFIEGGNSGSGGALIFGTPSSAALGVERLRITSGGDVLVGGQSARTYDDTGASNTILDVWNSGNNKRGILSLSGQTNGGAAIGTIWFNNDNNAGTSPAANMKLSAAIQADAVTSDSNASSDAGGFLKFYTKPEAGSLSESLRITSIGDIFQRDQRVHTCLHAEYRQLSGSVNTDSVGSFVDIKNFGYTPKRAGSLIVCHFQVQTWNGSSSNMNGDIYFRARFDQGSGNYVNVTYGGNNNRMTGNFDQDNNRQHLYYTHTFGFIAQNTNQHTINLQASNGSSLATDFNWFHTTDNSNGCWIFEYDN